MTIIAVPCRRHDHEVWDEPLDQWVCQKCGNRRPVRRDAKGSALARQGSR